MSRDADCSEATQLQVSGFPDFVVRLLTSRLLQCQYVCGMLRNFADRGARLTVITGAVLGRELGRFVAPIRGVP